MLLQYIVATVRFGCADETVDSPAFVPKFGTAPQRTGVIKRPGLNHEITTIQYLQSKSAITNFNHDRRSSK